MTGGKAVSANRFNPSIGGSRGGRGGCSNVMKKSKKMCAK